MVKEKGICIECSKEFDKGYHTLRGKWVPSLKQILCSKECRKKHYDKERVPKVTLTLTCEQCKKPFEKTGYEKSVKKVKYCGPDCNIKALKEKAIYRQKGTLRRGHLQISQSKHGFLQPRNVLEFQVGSQVYVPDYRFGYQQYCTYCGAFPQDIDHCIAWAYISASGARRSNVKGITTHSCFKCNSKLSDRMFDSFIERVIFMRNYYAEVLKKYFGNWTLKEIKQENFDYGLETFILDSYYTKQLCEERVKWTETKEFKEIMDQNKFAVIQNVEKLSPNQSAYLIEYFNLT